MTNYLEDLENWMSLLPDKIRDLAVIYLSIPGSHNTMTYAITRKSKPAPDADKTIKRVYCCFPCIVRRWAITQKCNVIDQLKTGVRFFDLRVAANNSKYFFVHGLYSLEVATPLWQIRIFLDEHPREFVILDFQHFYAFSVKDHENLINNIRGIFGEKMYTQKSGTLLQCSLNNAQRLGKQILIIYRSRLCPYDMLPSYYWPTPWPNTASIKKLREFLERSLQNREPDCGFVSQCIITPTSRYIILRCFSSLKRSAKKVDKRISDWISEQRPGPFEFGDRPTTNVFLGDFICINQQHFCKIVVELNKYLEDDVNSEEKV